MEQDPLNTPLQPRRVYTQGTIRTCTFLFGPLAGGYMLVENLKALDRTGGIKQAWFLTFAITVVFFSLGTFLPNPTHSPLIFIPILISGLFGLYFNSSQKESVEDFLASGGETQGFGRSFLVSVAAFVFTLIQFGIFYSVLHTIQKQVGF